MVIQPIDHRVVATSKSAQIPPHQHAGEPTGHRAGFCSLDEAGVFEELAGANVGHGEIDSLPLVIHGVTLDGWRTVSPSVTDSTLEQGVRDVFAAVTRPDSNAPHRPHRQLIDMGDLGRSREGKFGARCDGGPTDHLNPVVRQNAWRDPAAAEPLDVLTSSPTDERTIGLGVDPVA